LVVDVELDGGNLVEAGHRRRAIPPLAGDDLVAIRADAANEDRLEHALLANGGRQLFDVAQSGARLFRVRLDQLERDHRAAVPTRATGQLFDEVEVVTHRLPFGQAAFHGHETLDRISSDSE